MSSQQPMKRYWVPVGDDPLIPDTGQDFAGYAYEAVYLAADVEAVERENVRLQRELKGWRSKAPFITSQLPLPHGDHPTVQIYREKVVEFRDRYLRIAMYLADMLGTTVEELCEANLIWGTNALAAKEAELFSAQSEIVKAWEVLGILLDGKHEHLSDAINDLRDTLHALIDDLRSEIKALHDEAAGIDL